jgi:DnaJ-domain-containing protein 1
VVFTTGLVALAAKMAKSDGVVSRSEVEAFRRIVEVPDEARAQVERLFDLAKSTTAGFESYAAQIAEAFRDEPRLLEDVLDGLFHVAKADGAVHERELAYLESVAGVLGFDEATFERIVARHVRRKNDPYLVLGADPRHERRGPAPALPRPGQGDPPRPGDRARPAARGGEDRNGPPRRRQRRLGTHRRGARFDVRPFSLE